MIDIMIRALLTAGLAVLVVEVLVFGFGILFRRWAARQALGRLPTDNHEELWALEGGRLVEAAQELLDASAGLGPSQIRSDETRSEWRRAWLRLQEEVKRARARLIIESGKLDRLGFALRELSSIGNSEELDLISEVVDRRGVEPDVKKLAIAVESTIERRAKREAWLAGERGVRPRLVQEAGR